MKKVKLLKDHNGQPKDSIHLVEEKRAVYLVRCNIAEYVEEELKTAVKVEKKAPKKAVKEEPCKTC